MKTEFIPDLHAYLIDGREVPGPNEVLEDLGFKQAYSSSGAMNFGSEVHAMLEAWDKSGKGTEDEKLKPYLNAYCNAKAEIGFEVLKIEEPEYNNIHLMACTPDRTIKIRGDDSYRDMLCEIKTGAEQGWHRIQTAWQALCIGGSPKRFCLYIGPDKYKFVEHRDRKDIDIALAARLVFGFKHGR